MANGLNPVDKKKAGLQPISGVVSAQAISEEVGLTAGGSLNLRVDLDVSGVTVVGAITAKLQHRAASGSYEDLVGANASISISGNGIFAMRQNVEVAADQPNMPLRRMLRVVLTTTNAGDAITINKVWIQQEL